MTNEKFDPYRQIAVLTVRLWDVCLNGKGIGSDTYDYMKAEPRLGDLVLEMSTVYARLYNHSKGWAEHFDSGGLGFFVRTAVEPIENADEWVKENPEEPCPTETKWYIKAVATGEELRWYNCRFVRVPTELGR